MGIFLLFLIVVAVASLFTDGKPPVVQAEETQEIQELRAKVELLNLRITEAKSEYTSVADDTAKYRQLVSLGESQQKALNALNNARRAEMRIHERELDSFLALGSQTLTLP